ncbi:MAG: HDIG domain-containing protein, partial [Ureaplasma sp.]|nr:HDIG domain-containing protein [Ureaplasma sp.]
INNYYNEEKINFYNSLISIGEDTVKELKFKNIDPNLYEYIGKLRYRYSFGQNVLEHSIESALLAEQIAKEVNANPYIAKLSAFFHDIGKSMDHETGLDHIQLGVEIAQKYNLPQEVISGIATHHSSQISNNIYDAIVKISDKSSASRPGARNNTKESFFKRVKIYEDICMQFNEVQHVWVLQSGFVIKILLKPNIVSDSEIDGLIERIKLAFESNKLTSEYVLTIEIIKENIYQFKTKKIIQ